MIIITQWKYLQLGKKIALQLRFKTFFKFYFGDPLNKSIVSLESNSWTFFYLQYILYYFIFNLFYTSFNTAHDNFYIFAFVKTGVIS